MKRILSMAVAFAFVLAAAAVYAQTQTAPAAAKTAAPTVEKKVEAAKVPAAPATTAVATDIAKKDTKLEATDNCKKKGLAGEALESCVKDELAKIEKPKAIETAKVQPATQPVKVEAPKVPTAAPVTKPVEQKPEATTKNK